MRTLSTVTPKGVCPGCGVLIVTTKTGRIVQHDRAIDGFDDERPIKILVQCPGAGKEPRPDGITEKESDPERSSYSEKTAVPAPKYCDPEE